MDTISKSMPPWFVQLNVAIILICGKFCWVFLLDFMNAISSKMFYRLIIACPLTCSLIIPTTVYMFVLKKRLGDNQTEIKTLVGQVEKYKLQGNSDLIEIMRLQTEVAQLRWD